jgi:hypothetical protein
MYIIIAKIENEQLVKVMMKQIMFNKAVQAIISKE